MGKATRYIEGWRLGSWGGSLQPDMKSPQFSLGTRQGDGDGPQMPPLLGLERPLTLAPSPALVPAWLPDLVLVGGIERDLRHLGVSVPHLPHGAAGQLDALEQG